MTDRVNIRRSVSAAILALAVLVGAGGLLINPGNANAQSSAAPGPEVCQNCHAEAVKLFAGSKHGTKADKRTPVNAGGCVACHGADGKGQTTMGKKVGCKDYTDAKVQSAMKDDVAFKSVKEGMKEGDKVLMKPFAEKLTDAEIKALIAHMRTFKK